MISRAGWIVLAVALATTVLGYSWARQVAHEDAHATLLRQAVLVQRTLPLHLDATAQLLRATADLILMHRVVSSRSWQDYLELLQRHGLPGGLRRLGYAHRVANSERYALIAAMRANGMADYQIHPAHAAAVQLPVLYDAPVTSGAANLAGFDLSSDAGVAAALDRAAASGAVTLTDTTRLPELPGDRGVKPGPAHNYFLMVLPVFPDGVLPATVAQRRQLLTGFVFAVMQLDARMVEPAAAALQIFDGDRLAAPGLLYETDLHVADNGVNIPLNLYGHRWTLRAGAGVPDPSHVSTLLFAAGVLVSILFAATTDRLEGWRVQHASFALRRRREARANKVQLAALIELSEQAVIRIDRKHRIMSFNPAAERVFRTNALSVIGTSLRRFLPDGLKTAEAMATVRLSEAKVVAHRLANRDRYLARRSDGARFAFQMALFKGLRQGQQCQVLLLNEIAAADSQCTSSSRPGLPEPRTPPAPRFGRIEIRIADDPYEAHITWSGGLFALVGSGLETGSKSLPVFIEEWLHQDDQRAVLRQMLQIFRSEMAAGCHYRLLLPDGSERQVSQWVWLTENRPGLQVYEGALYELGAGELKALAEVSADAGQVKHEPALLRRIHSFDLAHAEHQKRIAQEMHDDFGQLLTAMKIDLTLLQRHLADVDLNLVHRLVGINELVDTMVTSVRRIMVDLPPQLIAEHGLFKAIELLSDGCSKRHRLSCKLTLPRPQPNLSEAVATALYRITQEALNNIGKHARASAIGIHIDATPLYIALEITDNGIGVSDDQRKKPGSFGLIGMQDRVTALNGTLHFESEAGRGTAIRIRIPLGSSNLDAIATSPSTAVLT